MSREQKLYSDIKNSLQGVKDRAQAIKIVSDLCAQHNTNANAVLFRIFG